MDVGLFTDRRMLDHRVPARHPERPERLQAILRHLERTGYLVVEPGGPVREATRRSLPGFIHQRTSTGCRARSGGRWDARPGHLGFRRVRPGRSSGRRSGNRGGLVRARGTGATRALPGSPAGTPCPADSRHGFLHLRQVSPWPPRLPSAQHEVNRVLIVDFDVHHGNGTQEIFYESERVGFLSIHRYPFYPGTGARDETGTGAGLGTHRQHPAALRHRRREYHAAFRSGLEKLADRFEPELVLISAGFDAHAEDPVGDLGLEIEDFEILTKEIVAVAETPRRGPDRQPARGRVQRAHPRRLRSPRISGTRAPSPAMATGRSRLEP